MDKESLSKTHCCFLRDLFFLNVQTEADSAQDTSESMRAGDGGGGVQRSPQATVIHRDKS